MPGLRKTRALLRPSPCRTSRALLLRGEGEHRGALGDEGRGGEAGASVKQRGRGEGGREREREGGGEGGEREGESESESQSKSKRKRGGVDWYDDVCLFKKIKGRLGLT